MEVPWCHNDSGAPTCNRIYRRSYYGQSVCLFGKQNSATNNHRQANLQKVSRHNQSCQTCRARSIALHKNCTTNSRTRKKPTHATNDSKSRTSSTTTQNGLTSAFDNGNRTCRTGPLSFATFSRLARHQSRPANQHQSTRGKTFVGVATVININCTFTVPA